MLFQRLNFFFKNPSLKADFLCALVQISILQCLIALQLLILLRWLGKFLEGREWEARAAARCPPLLRPALPKGSTGESGQPRGQFEDGCFATHLPPGEWRRREHSS